MRPPRSLVPTGVEHNDQRRDWWFVEAVYNIIGVSLLVLNVQMELLQVCGPFLMAIILKLPMCLYELQRSVVYVDGCFLPRNVMLPLTICLHNEIHFFVIGGIISDYL